MSKFFEYIHNLRGVAILFVVIVHCRALQPEWLSHENVNRFFDTFFDPSEGNGTILFLFIGGFLFQHLTHQHFEFKKYLEQKFKVIILPYLIISIPLIILRLNTPFQSLSLPAGFSDWPVSLQVIYMILTGAHMPPFWFIPTIVLFYFTAPLLHAIDGKFFYRYVFPFVILISLFTYRPVHNANPFMSYVHYIPIYLMGMWASYNRQFLLANANVLLGFTAFTYVVLCYMDLTGLNTLSRKIFFEDVLYNGVVAFNIYIFKAIILCFMMMFLLYKFRTRSMPLLEILGHYSFGIFFVHFLFISVSREILEKLNIQINFSIPAYLIFFSLVLGVSILTVYIVKKLTGKSSRYLIGS